MEAQVSFVAKPYSSTIVRPANTTAYSAGDVLAAVTTNACFVLGTAWDSEVAVDTLDSVGRRNAKTKSGSIDWLSLVSSYVGASYPIGTLLVFSEEPTLAADNAAAAITLTELEDTLIASFPVRSTDWQTINSRAVCHISGSSRVFSLPDVDAGGTGQLFAVFVFSAAYTPASSQRITLRANVTRD